MYCRAGSPNQRTKPAVFPGTTHRCGAFLYAFPGYPGNTAPGFVGVQARSVKCLPSPSGRTNESRFIEGMMDSVCAVHRGKPAHTYLATRLQPGSHKPERSLKKSSPARPPAALTHLPRRVSGKPDLFAKRECDRRQHGHRIS